MKNFRQLKNPEWARIIKLRQQLKDHSELWNQRQERIAAPPFTETQDIWVRANDDRPFREGRKPWGVFNDPHWPIWYETAKILTGVEPLVHELMAQVHGEHLGSVLITRIPAGCQVKPHKDSGWHATFHNCKVYVPLWSNERCWNHAGTERVNMLPGEAWSFNNLIQHSVINQGDTDRVTLIISMKVKQWPPV